MVKRRKTNDSRLALPWEHGESPFFALFSGRRLWPLVTLLALTAAFVLPALAGISTTKHNLSAGGPGTYRATGETEICIFCHTPHNANAGKTPLWNRRIPTAAYTPYTSSTLKSAPGQPNGASIPVQSAATRPGQSRSATTPQTVASGTATAPTDTATTITSVRTAAAATRTPEPTPILRARDWAEAAASVMCQLPLNPATSLPMAAT